MRNVLLLLWKYFWPHGKWDPKSPEIFLYWGQRHNKVGRAITLHMVYLELIPGTPLISLNPPGVIPEKRVRSSQVAPSPEQHPKYLLYDRISGKVSLVTLRRRKMERRVSILRKQYTGVLQMLLFKEVWCWLLQRSLIE